MPKTLEDSHGARSMGEAIQSEGPLWLEVAFCCVLLELGHQIRDWNRGKRLLVHFNSCCARGCVFISVRSPLLCDAATADLQTVFGYLANGDHMLQLLSLERPSCATFGWVIDYCCAFLTTSNRQFGRPRERATGSDAHAHKAALPANRDISFPLRIPLTPVVSAQWPSWIMCCGSCSKSSTLLRRPSSAPSSACLLPSPPTVRPPPAPPSPTPPSTHLIAHSFPSAPRRQLDGVVPSNLSPQLTMCILACVAVVVGRSYFSRLS